MSASEYAPSSTSRNLRLVYGPAPDDQLHSKSLSGVYGYPYAKKLGNYSTNTFAM